MASRSRLSLRQGAGTILMVLGVLFWMLAVVFPLTTLHVRLLASLDHSDKLSLVVVAGGASLAGGIILLLAPHRRRPWRSDERHGRAFTTQTNAGSSAYPSAYNSLDFAGTLRPPPRTTIRHTGRNAEDDAIAHAGLEHHPVPGPTVPAPRGGQ